MNCFYCGALISNGAINSARRRARVSQCPRFSCRWRCGQCKQTFNYECLYKSLLKHKELFKNTMIEINTHTFPIPINRRLKCNTKSLIQFQSCKNELNIIF